MVGWSHLKEIRAMEVTGNSRGRGIEVSGEGD